jgi:hypothetical protein
MKQVPHGATGWIPYVLVDDLRASTDKAKSRKNACVTRSICSRVPFFIISPMIVGHTCHETTILIFQPAALLGFWISREFVPVEFNFLLIFAGNQKRNRVVKRELMLSRAVHREKFLSGKKHGAVLNRAFLFRLHPRRIARYIAHLAFRILPAAGFMSLIPSPELCQTFECEATPSTLRRPHARGSHALDSRLGTNVASTSYNGSSVIRMGRPSENPLCFCRFSPFHDHHA